MMKTRGECSRCGAEDSMFWYPYAFGVAPLPGPAAVGPSYRDCQFYCLCDKCQQDFIEFMHNKSWPFFDGEKLAEMMENAEPMPFVVKEGKE